MTKIQDIHNKPLKCIVTRNANTIEYMKNSGNLIVFDRTPDPEKGNDYRELYLSNNFIAGGYGVYNKEQQDLLIEILNKWIATINRLDNKDVELNDLIRSLYDELNQNKLDKTAFIYDDENNRIGVKPGYEQANASDTYIVFNTNNTDYYIRTADIIKLLTNLPVYENIEILNVSYDVTISNYSGNDQTFTNVKYLPIHTQIKKIVVNIKADLHDCGNIQQIDMICANNNTQAATTSFMNISYRFNNPESVDGNIVDLSIEKTYSAGQYLVKPGENDLIKNIKLLIAETPRSKYKTITNVSTISGERDIKYIVNKIPEQRDKEIEIPSIIGTYFLSYYTTNDTNTNNIQENLQNNINLKYKEIVEYNYKTEDTKYTIIDNITNDTKFIVLCLPIKYLIKNVFIISNYKETNITNFVNVFKHENNQSIVNNLKTSIYVIYISSGLKNNCVLKLDIIKNDTMPDSDMMIETPQNLNTIVLNDNNLSNIINLEYSHTYWIDRDAENFGTDINVKNNHFKFLETQNFQI